MATNVLMKVTSTTPIKGSSTIIKDSIEIVSWSHGFSLPLTGATRGIDAATASRANHMDFSFTKFFDASSSGFTKVCWSGEQLTSVELEIYRATGGGEDTKDTKYLTIKMEHVYVSHYSISGGGDELPIENITLNYGIITYTYNPVKTKDGTPGTAQAAIKHDLQKNVVS